DDIEKNTPTLVDSGTAYKAVSAGGSHTCGITMDDVLKCWGENNRGQVGDGTYSDRETPVVIDSGVSYSSVSAGLEHTCAITTAGVLKCWGSNWEYQLGIGDYDMDRSSPA